MVEERSRRGTPESGAHHRLHMAEREPVTGAWSDDRARTCGVGDPEPRRRQASHQGSRYAAGLALDQIGEGRCRFIDRAANGPES